MAIGETNMAGMVPVRGIRVCMQADTPTITEAVLVQPTLEVLAGFRLTVIVATTM